LLARSYKYWFGLLRVVEDFAADVFGPQSRSPNSDDETDTKLIA